MTDEQILADALREGEPITYGSKSLPVLIQRVKADQLLIVRLVEALDRIFKDNPHWRECDCGEPQCETISFALDALAAARSRK